jgi:nucleotide-binding universal stress UspA family protein
MMTISHILCPVDFSEFASNAVGHAVAMARWYDARLTLLHVFVNMGTMDLPPVVLGDTDRKALLEDMRQLAGPSRDLAVEVLLREASDASSEILHQTQALGADLLVVGSHGRKGFERLLLGSVTEKVIRLATCPVMVVPRRAPEADRTAPVLFHSVLCPVDFSEGSISALTYALSIAQESDATLTVMHTVEVPPELSAYMPPADFDIEAARGAALNAGLERLRDLIPDSARTFCSIDTIAEEGTAYRQILRVADERRSDLIVMGVRGRGALDLLLFGSNTARVTRAAACPVLVVR